MDHTLRLIRCQTKPAQKLSCPDL